MSRFLVAALLALSVTDERTPVPGFFDLPVTGGTATFAVLGLHPEERGTAISLLARSMFSHGGSAAERAASARRYIASLASPSTTGNTESEERGAPITIAVPLTADHWRDLLGPKAPRDLFTALISDRSVLLLCAGTLTTDPSIRALLERDRGLLRWIARTAPAAFWVAARSLRLDKDRLQVPGGSAAERIWETLAGERLARTSDFLRALLAKDGGRLAWFYDAMATMPAERAAHVYGGGPVEYRLEQVQQLYDAFRSADSNWRIEDHPFLRGVSDPWMVTTQMAVSDGALGRPTREWFWDAIFNRPGLIVRKSAAEVERIPDTPVTLAWMVRNITRAVAKERRDRFAMVRFAQSVFRGMSEDDSVDAMIAISGYRRYPALLLSLDRMAITSPRVYSRAVEAAMRIDDLSGRDRRHAVIAFQAALAILERARLTGAIDVATAERMVLALAEATESNPRRARAITQWMVSGLTGALPPLIQPDQWTAQTAYESRFLQALAGVAATSPPTVKWEGLDYRVDYFGSEHARIKRIREQLTSPGLDAALAAGNEEDVADALLVLIYAPALGDPEGAALLGGDIPMRHNFGIEGAAGVRRESLAWSLPREQVGDGSPWHIEGSLLGLDIALARLNLRRLADNEMPVAPTINLNDLLTLARTVRALNPDHLNNGDRDALVAAIARGRARVAAAGTRLPDLLALAEEAGVSHAIRQTLPWTLTRTPELAATLFGLRDLMWLGTPQVPAASLDQWGLFTEVLSGRFRTTMPGPVPWESFGGRADGGVIGAQLPDLTLRLAEETVRLGLPAQLIPALLTYATQDFWHDVDSRFPDDWPAMARQALALSPSRVEDYVAALAGDGPLRPR